MLARSAIAAALVAGLAVAGQAAAADAQPAAQHRKLSQGGIDEGEVTYEIFVAGAEQVLDGGFGGIDGEDFAGDVLGPLFAPFANSLGQGVEYVLQPVYGVLQQVPGLGVCN